MYPQGRMSHHFREMRVGDHLAVKGPKVLFYYPQSCLLDITIQFVILYPKIWKLFCCFVTF